MHDHDRTGDDYIRRYGSCVTWKITVLGPMMNTHLVGLELAQGVRREVFPRLNKDNEPNPILQETMDAGHTVMRSGQGFYEWTLDLLKLFTQTSPAIFWR